jgi:hypothetical protein
MIILIQSSPHTAYFILFGTPSPLCTFKKQGNFYLPFYLSFFNSSIQINASMSNFEVSEICIPETLYAILRTRIDFSELGEPIITQ